MIHKARDNLNLANMLIGWNEPDGAANRLYYALYHAGWVFLEKQGCSVPEVDGRRYFLHREMTDRLEDEGFESSLGLGSDWGVRWQELLGLRVKADYRPDSVGRAELDDVLFEFVRSVVCKVGRLPR